jgi:nicotinate-nucleotide adenylyltransferase
MSAGRVRRRPAPRIGVLGGTFDPVHNGHLAMARAAQRACGLERVYFVAAPRPWHREHPPVAGYADRHAMLALALQGRRDWQPVAIPDAGRRATYTVDQLAWIAAREPQALLTSIVGADAWLTLPGWRQWRRLLGMCDWAVLARQGTASGQLAAIVPPSLVAAGDAGGLTLRSGRRLRWIQNFRHTASATQARRELARGGRSRQIPAAVAEYARRADLYSVERNG